MSLKKISLYAFGVITIAGIGIGSHYYWDEIRVHANHIHEDVQEFIQANLLSEKEGDKIAEADASEKKDEDKAEEEQTCVKLTPEQIQKLGLEVKNAAGGDIHLNLSARGKIVLHPDRLAHIIPKVSGIAREARKNIGNPVKSGEVIAVLDSHEMADLKASFLAALSKQRIAAVALQREEKLFQDKVSVGQDLLNMKSNFEEAEIHVNLAKQKLKAFGLTNEEIERLGTETDTDLSKYEIKSPIDGMVIKRHITNGEFIEDASTIYEVADLSVVWVEIGIYPKDLYRIKEGQTIDISMPMEDKKGTANLIYVSPTVDEDTIITKAVGQIDNSNGAWKPGVFVNVDIATDTVKAPVIAPQHAVQKIGGKDCVFVVTPEGYEKREVKLGQCDKENVEIISGLNSGDQYVENKAFLLKADLGKSSVEED